MTGVTLGSRVVPARLLGDFRAHRLWERNWLVTRRIWRLVFSGFFEPVFYLFAIGVGLGKLVPDIVGPGGDLVDYTAWVAPALLASSAMNGAVFESTFNIFFKLKFGKVYDGILTTPMRPRDVAIGEIGWSLFRGGVYTAGFLLVMAAMGLIESPWGILALPTAALIILAFGGVGMAATTFMKGWQDFDLINLVTIPLFLFSATFYPLAGLPGPIQVLTRLSPLYHGVELLRGLTVGVVDWTMLGHAVFLVAMATAGLAVSARRLKKLLMK